jgi:tetratricopeptide (TPR) repeat protein
MINLKEKFKVFFIGLITAILLIELSLRIFGIVYSKGNYTGKMQPDSYTILCLGDSWTFGLGAPKNRNYPSQLSDLLNSIMHNKKITVINKGMPAQNTTQLIDELQDDIESIKPDLIILLTGEANNWNFFGYQKYLKSKIFFSALYNQLYHIKTFKLVKLLRIDIRNKIQEKVNFLLNNLINKKKSKSFSADMEFVLRNDAYAENNKNEIVIYPESKNTNSAGDKIDKDLKSINNPSDTNEIIKSNDFEKELNWIKEGIKLNSLDSNNYFKIAEIYKEQGKYDEAMKWYREGIRVNPGDSRNYRGIGLSYEGQGKYDEAMKWYREGIRVNPDDLLNYEMISSFYKRHGRYKEAIDFFKGLEKINPTLKDFVKILEKKDNINKEVVDWITSDIEKIIKICEGNKIALILHNYPCDKELANILRDIVKRHPILFVDNYRIFQEMTLNGRCNDNDYFMPDGHCNPKGYGIIAKNLYDKIIEAKLIN